jgi:hypothetical protein
MTLSEAQALCRLKIGRLPKIGGEVCVKKTFEIDYYLVHDFDGFRVREFVRHIENRKGESDE